MGRQKKEIMTIEEAIKQRHSVRKYIHKPLSTEVVRATEPKAEKEKKQRIAQVSAEKQKIVLNSLEKIFFSAIKTV